MPLSDAEFQLLNEDGPLLDLSPDTTQGAIYQFLDANPATAFRQHEIIDAVDVPQGSVGPTLKRLEQHGLVEHRGRYWKISDADQAVASAVDARADGLADVDADAALEIVMDLIEEDDDDSGV